MEKKYLRQLTLAVIESESVAQPTAFTQQHLSKPSTAGNNRVTATLEIPDEQEYETTIDETTITAEREHE